MTTPLEDDEAMLTVQVGRLVLLMILPVAEAAREAARQAAKGRCVRVDYPESNGRG
jgi:hypothetical protein